MLTLVRVDLSYDQSVGESAGSSSVLAQVQLAGQRSCGRTAPPAQEHVMFFGLPL